MPVHHSLGIFVLLVPFGLLVFGGFFLFHRYTGLPRSKALLALLASVIPTAIYIARQTLSIHGSGQMEAASSALAGGSCIVFVTAFALRLWGRWVGEKATVQERQSGLAGVNAWFSASNVFVGAAIVLCAWYGFNLPPLQIAIAVGVLLAVYPVVGMGLAAPASAPVQAPDDVSAEREKIVSMLVAGKLTADESAELLHALGSTSRTPLPQVAMTSGRRLMLTGAALVLVGFFLPWIVINPGQEANRIMRQMQSSSNGSFGTDAERINALRQLQQMQSSFSGSFDGGMQLPNGIFASGTQLTTPTTPTIAMSGGDIPRGLGWVTLALAMLAAVFPYLNTALDAGAGRAVLLLCLGAGSVIILYILTQNIRFLGVGLIIAVAGYALEFVGALRDQRSLKA